MSSPSSPVMISSDDEIAPKSPLVTPPKFPKFMPVSADRTAEVEFSEGFYSPGDEPEPVEEKSEPSGSKSQPTTILHITAETGNEVTALRLQLGQNEQRIAELEQQVTIMKDAKRKWEENPGGSSGRKKGKPRKTVNKTGPDVKKRYKGKKPHCNQCNLHHTGQCKVQCGQCKKPGHLTKDCRGKAPVNNQSPNNPNNQGNPRACYECGGVGHLKAQCGNLKNKNNSA